MTIDLFPISEYWWLYAGFVLFVFAMLALDLGVFHRKVHAVGFKEAGAWSAVWIALSLLFAFALYQYASWKFPQDARLNAIAGFDAAAQAKGVGLEFLTGYVIEKALSVDNIFIFVVIFSYFRIPTDLQHRVLFYGILGALLFRAIFIALGAALMKYHAVLYVFGAFLILTGIKMIFTSEKEVDPEKNALVKLVRKLVPITTEARRDRFFLKLEDGRWAATPLFLALVFLEFTDVIFAVDSVPAIFAITDEPLIVFTSNIFAILGLRSLYFLLAGMVDKFHYLKFGLAAVLVFVGLKMVWLNDAFGGKFPIGLSLAIIGGVIGISVVVSLAFPRKVEAAA